MKHAITNKHSEFIEKTELLSPRGWVSVSEISPGDEVMTMDLDGNMSYDSIAKTRSTHIAHQMIHFHSGRIDLTINPDGCIPIYKYKPTGSCTENIIVSAESIKKLRGIQGGNLSWNGIIPPSKFSLPSTKSVDLADKNDQAKSVPIDAWLKLYGLYMRKGSSYNTNKNNVSDSSSARIGFPHSGKNSDKDADKTCKLLKSCGFSPIKNHDKSHTVSCYDSDLALYFKDVSETFPMKLDTSYLKYSSKYLSSLFYSYLKAENVFALKKHFKTKNLREAELIQELILKSFGMITQIHRSPDKGYYYISFDGNKASDTIMLGEKETIDYSGKVYEVETEKNNILLVRQNSAIGWIGTEASI